MSLEAKSYQTNNNLWYHSCMNKHKIGNAIASLLFLVVAFVFYTHNDSGVGTMFVVFAAVYLGLTFSDKYKK